jgi:hypothetical protein
MNEMSDQKRWRVTIEMTRTDHVLTRLGRHVDVYVRNDPGLQEAVIVAIEEMAVEESAVAVDMADRASRDAVRNPADRQRLHLKPLTGGE